MSIDERRAKFRQDLVSEQRNNAVADHPHHAHLSHHHEKEKTLQKKPTMKAHHSEARFRPRKHPQHEQRLSVVSVERPASSAASQISVNSATIIEERKQEDTDHELMDDEDNQDILEVWFAGQHGDIGGGEHIPI